MESNKCPLCGGSLLKLSTGDVCMSCTKSNIQIFDEKHLAKLQLSSSSKGNQVKWYCLDTNEFIKGQFGYQGKMWRDDLVEIIASIIGKQLLTNIQVVKQELCVVRKTSGELIYCIKSKNFLDKDRNEYFTTLLRLDSSLSFKNEFPIAVFEGILKVIKDKTNLDVTEYLIAMVIIDFLVCNEDRHLNNIGVVSVDGDFRVAPLFDFGLGLFEHDKKYDGKSLENALTYTECQPSHSEPYSIIAALKRSKRYGEILNSMLPAKINLVGVEMPNDLALQYLKYACGKIGVDLIV